MEFELQYELEQFKEIQDQYFDEDGKCHNRHILSTNIAEKMLSLIDNLAERVNELESEREKDKYLLEAAHKVISFIPKGIILHNTRQYGKTSFIKTFVKYKSLKENQHGR